MLGLGWLAGSALGIGLFGFVLPSLEVYPRLPPPPAFAVPVGPVVYSAVLVAVTVLGSALASQWLAQRTRPAEILRLE